MLASFTSSLLANVAPIFINEFNQSAKSYATFGLTSSESDYINARDIFNVNRMFFSAGYLPSLTAAGDNDGEANASGSIDASSNSSMGGYSADFDTSNSGTMSVYMASPINVNLTFGIAAEYKMYSTYEGYESLGAYVHPTWYPTGLGSVAATDTVYQKRTKDYSEFNALATIMLDRVSLHYNIARIGFTQITEHHFSSQYGLDLASGKRIDDNSIWQHEFALGYKGDSFHSYVEVGLILDKYVLVSSSTPSQNFVDSQEAKWLYINPEVTINMDKGVLKEIVTGVDSTFLLEYAGITSYAYSGVNLYVKPLLEHSLWDEKIGLLLEPVLGVNAIYDHTVQAMGAYYDIHVEPYVGAKLATLVRPLEWLELRFGLEYELLWDYLINRHFDHYYTSYDYSSTFGASMGLGINIGEYFSLDIYVQSGQSADNLASGTVNDSGDEVSDSVSSTSDIFSINSYGVSLIYKF